MGAGLWKDGSTIGNVLDTLQNGWMFSMLLWSYQITKACWKQIAGDVLKLCISALASSERWLIYWLVIVGAGVAQRVGI